jgi:catechol 2,3-dioxygenase-like lactoylglutathione lyase family enzyme
VYLTSGGDNVALHQADPETEREEGTQRLDHIGFFLDSAEDVDQWFAWLGQHEVRMRNEPRTHRDGARSFYCYDPDGTLVQMIHHPEVNQWEQLRGVN